MSQQVRIPQTVYDQAEEIKESRDYPSLGEAIRHVFQECDYDV